MATLKKTILGRVSGTIGDVVFRNKHGRNFVSSKPASFRAPSDEESLARRERFKLNVKFAVAITSLLPLKEIWRAQKPARMSVQNFIIRKNFFNITHNNVGNSSIIVPVSGFLTQTNSFNLSDSSLRAILLPVGSGSGIDPLTETIFRLCTVTYLFSPSDTSLPGNAFFTLISEPVLVDLDEPVSFEINLSPVQSALFRQYQSSRTFCVLITFNAENKIVKFSSTFSA